MGSIFVVFWFLFSTFLSEWFVFYDCHLSYMLSYLISLFFLFLYSYGYYFEVNSKIEKEVFKYEYSFFFRHTL